MTPSTLQPDFAEMLAALDEVQAEYIVVERNDLAIPSLGRETLLCNERASGRPKDLADVAAMKAMRILEPIRAPTRVVGNKSANFLRCGCRSGPAPIVV